MMHYMRKRDYRPPRDQCSLRRHSDSMLQLMPNELKNLKISFSSYRNKVVFGNYFIQTTLCMQLNRWSFKIKLRKTYIFSWLSVWLDLHFCMETWICVLLITPVFFITHDLYCILSWSWVMILHGKYSR